MVVKQNKTNKKRKAYIPHPMHYHILVHNYSFITAVIGVALLEIDDCVSSCYVDASPWATQSMYTGKGRANEQCACECIFSATRDAIYIYSNIHTPEQYIYTECT